MAVLIVDSGSGGLSVLESIVQLCPEKQYVFIADTLGFPYGGRSEDFVLNRVLDTIQKTTEQKIQPQAIVVACNTASTIVLPALRAKYACPVIGVVPAIKTAAQLTVTKHIGLLATQATISREYTKNLIEEFASDCQVSLFGSTNLVYLAEEWIQTAKCDVEQLKDELEQIAAQKNLDALVLGCTHYPLLESYIRDAIPTTVKHIIDSGEAIARRVKSLLPSEAQNFDGNKKSSVGLFYTERNAVAQSIEAYLLNKYATIFSKALTGN